MILSAKHEGFSKVQYVYRVNALMLLSLVIGEIPIHIDFLDMMTTLFPYTTY